MKQRYKPFLQTLIDASAPAIQALSGKALRSAYKASAASIRGRIIGFKKAGELEAVPKKFRDVPKIASFETEAGMREALKEQLRYIRGEVSHIKGYEKVISDRAVKVGKKLGLDFKSTTDYKKFGKFMGEMAQRLPATWGSASDFAVTFREQSRRLHIDPKQLMRNFEYWADHVDDLKAMDPIKGRRVKAADYLEKAKLESIEDYYKKHPKESEDDIMVSEEFKKRRRKKRR